MLGRLWQEMWLTLFVILVAVGVFAGQGMVIGFGVMGLLIAGVSWLWSRTSLDQVAYERRLPLHRAFIGDEVDLTVALVNRKPVPLAWIRVEDEIPRAIEVIDAEMGLSANPDSNTLRHATSMSWYERVRWDYSVRCNERGLHKLGPVRIESGDLFGFFDNHTISYVHDYLLVYPKVVPLAELGIPGARPLGEVAGGITLFEDLSRPSGIRDYERGDPLKIVDWKATAKTRRMQVRTFEPSSSIMIVLAVAVDTTGHYWEGYSPTNLERVITAAASVADYAAGRSYGLGLFSNGAPVMTDRPMIIAPSRDPGQLSVILEALASMRPLATAPMARMLEDHGRTIPLGSTVVLVTSFVPPELSRAIGDLKSRGLKIVVLYVGDDPNPQVPEGVLVHDIRDYFIDVEQSA